MNETHTQVNGDSGIEKVDVDILIKKTAEKDQTKLKESKNK